VIKRRNLNVCPPQEGILSSLAIRYIQIKIMKIWDKTTLHIIDQQKLESWITSSGGGDTASMKNIIEAAILERDVITLRFSKLNSHGLEILLLGVSQTPIILSV
jgi:hypothetical protein